MTVRSHEFLLQQSDLMAQGRLRHMQAFRSASEVQLFSDCNYVSEVTKFHGYYGSLRVISINASRFTCGEEHFHWRCVGRE